MTKWLLAWAIGWSPVAAAQEITLAQALTYALEGNLELERARLARRDAVYDIQSAAGVFDPSVAAGVRVSGARTPTNAVVDGLAFVNSSSTSWNVGLAQQLPTGGSVSATWSEGAFRSDSANSAIPASYTSSLSVSLAHPLLRGAGTVAGMSGVLSARVGATERELAWRGELEQLVLDVSAAYWRLVSAREAEVLAGNSVQLAERQLQDTLERQEQGFAGSGDVLQVQRTLGTARQTLVAASAESQSADDRLSRLLGHPLEQERTWVPVDRPVVPGEPPSRDEVLELARERNTGWRVAQLTSQYTDLALRRARNGVMPDVSARAGFGLQGLDDTAAGARAELFEELSPTWNVSVDLSFPVAMRTQRAGLASAKLDAARAEATVAAAEQDLILSVDAGLRAVARDRSRVQLAEATLEYARLGVEADQQLLNDGRGSTRDVVRSLESLREAQVGMLSASIDLQSSMLELSRLSGNLLESMAIPAE
jgi:outer membrane protein